MVLHKLLRWMLLLRCLCEVVSTAASERREVLVKEVVLDSAVVDIVYLGKKHECVLVTTKNKRLYYSQDTGMSWEEITDKVDRSSRGRQGWKLEVERVIVNPTDKTIAVLQVQRRRQGSLAPFPTIFVTEDSGKTWRKAWGDPKGSSGADRHGLHNWIPHPTEPKWALVSWWAGNCDKRACQEAGDCDKPCVHKLMITKDLGRNFLQIAEYVVQFSWGSANHNQNNRVYYTSYRQKSGDQGRLSSWTQEVDLSYVDISPRGRPRGAPTECLKQGNKFLISGEYVLVAKVNDEAAQTVHLMVSKDGGKTFKAALLPSGMGELEEKWYTILDTSEGAVILHINSNTEAGPSKDTGRIFVSDDSGFKYSQSLVNNVRSTHGECEFDKVVSLQGVYLANIVVPPAGMADLNYARAAAAAQDQVEGEAAGGSEVDQKHGIRAGIKKAKASKEERTIRSVISFDKGGAWSHLKPPKVNSFGKAYECSGKPIEQCALHLHGTTSWDFYAPFYSSETAVGLIMGTGNVGSQLRFEPEETNTYLSRDGGLTWLEAHKGAFIYEFGDHGGLIIMADDLKKTNQVVFSWNEGQSWFDFTVTGTPFEVDNIITEPNVTSTTFIMFGTRDEGVGVMYYMKFDSLQFPACKGVWAADSVSSDYETWTASDGVSEEKCVLGQQVTYTRRKRTSQCWNGEKFERPSVQKKCACTQEDFACDVGFVRSVGSTECVFGGQDMMPDRFVPTVCTKTFSTNAYRKVAGDQCEGGWTPVPQEVPCPSGGFHVTHGSGFVMLILAAIVLYVGYQKCLAGGGGRGKHTGFGEFTAATSSFGGMSPMAMLQLPLIGLVWIYTKFCSRGHPDYKPVNTDDFDLDGPMTDESLTDFLDEAEYDDHAPRVYDGAAADDRQRTTVVSGGASAAKASVPKLQAPPALGGAQHFDMSDKDSDDLL